MKSLLRKSKYLLIPLVMGIFLVASAPKAQAAYTDNNIIDDSIFLNSASMSQADIQSFLTSKGGGLANYSAPNTDPGQNNRMMSAAEIIYFTSQYVGINPRVIMATLQKEQSLITDPNPSAGKYNYAMGYGCPDSGGCSGSSGFYYQVVTGAWQLRLNFERAGGSSAPWTSPSGRTWGTNIGYACPSATRYYSTGLYAGRSVTFYSDNGTAYKTFNLDNRGTASMYCYTPHAYNPSGVPQYYSGSYNFVASFESWWGSTRAASYGYSYVSQTSDRSLSNLVSGQAAVLTVVVKNTGTTTWTNTGNNPIRIAPSRQIDRNSQFYDVNWLAPYRVGTMQESAVAPDQNATFVFAIQAPAVGSLTSFREDFRLLVEGIAWLPDIDLHYNLSVLPAQLQGSLVSGSLPASITANTTQVTTIGIQNTGNTTWYKGGRFPIRIGTSNPRDRRSIFDPGSWVSPTRLATLTNSEVPPGSTGTFTFGLRAPNLNGTYPEAFALSSDGFGWFNTPALAVNVSVSGGLDLVGTPVYRLYNPRNGEHFFTTVPGERDAVQSSLGFSYEGIAMSATTNNQTNPVFRLYDPRTGRHFWTADPGERDAVQRSLGFTYEGIAFYGAPVATSHPVYRLYNPRNGEHFLTADPGERDAVQRSLGFTYEGIAFYSL